MRRAGFISLICILSLTTKAQTVKAILKKNVVTVNESFPIQYIVEDLQEGDQFIDPQFKGFRIPSRHENDGWTNVNGIPKPIKNITFTLVATRPGRFIIEGPRIKVENKLIRTDNVIIEVIDKAESFERDERELGADYFLSPGEDPYEKIKKNLFMKVTVNKRECYVGEPILATFKLYSRLTSKSDIVKNPGFYGFTVQDIINLNDNMVTTESLNGKMFDVHTIRSVQLYPLQAGLYTIDPMEVTNKVEFSKSAVNKKTEQEIVEGVFDDHNPSPHEGTIVYESSIKTEKLTIRVKPLPDSQRPPAFTGATGRFSVHAHLEKNALAKNEEGMLVITVNGKGNFTQLAPPVITWPGGIENFEPVIKDSLNKAAVPLKGRRTFRFPFVSSKPGEFIIPAVSFSFFDPDSNEYHSVTTDQIKLTVLNAEKKVAPNKEQPNNVKETRDYKSLWIYAGIFAVVALIIAFQFRKPKKPAVEEMIVQQPTGPSSEQLLQPAQFSLMTGDNNFYNLLQKGIWEHFSNLLHLSGSRRNKAELYRAMRASNIDESVCNDLMAVLQECEAAIFTKAELSHDKELLLKRARSIIDATRA